MLKQNIPIPKMIDEGICNSLISFCFIRTVSIAMMTKKQETIGIPIGMNQSLTPVISSNVNRNRSNELHAIGNHFRNLFFLKKKGLIDQIKTKIRLDTTYNDQVIDL